MLGVDHASQTFLIPCITISPSDLDLPFVLERHQFPICLGFCMSINKAQRQSVTVVGLKLQIPVLPMVSFMLLSLAAQQSKE